MFQSRAKERQKRLAFLLAIGAAGFAPGCSSGRYTLRNGDHSSPVYMAIGAKTGGDETYALYFSAAPSVVTVSYCDAGNGTTCADYKTASFAGIKADRRIFVDTTGVTLAAGKHLLVIGRDAKSQQVFEVTLGVFAAGQNQLNGNTTNNNGDSDASDTFVSTATSFKLTAYYLPSPDQLGGGDCLYMTATGIVEFLLNQSRGIKHPQLGGDTDLSEEQALTLAQEVQLNDEATDAPFLFSTYGSYILDKDLPFTFFNDESWINGTGIDLTAYPQHDGLPKFDRTVLFPQGGQTLDKTTNGVMSQETIEAMKKALKSYKSPILFVFKPPTVSWWHADMIVGYDDDKQVLIMRDSAFGERRNDLPLYDYGGKGQPTPYRDLYEMPYQSAIAWGNHASVYYLTH